MVNKGRGKSVRLSFNPVGEVTCNNLKIGSTYFNDFLARQGAARLNPRNLARLGVQPALSTFAERVKRDAAEVQSTRASSIRSAKSRAQSRSVSQRSGSIHSRGQANNDKYSLKIWITSPTYTVNWYTTTRAVSCCRCTRRRHYRQGKGCHNQTWWFTWYSCNEPCAENHG